MSYGEFGLKKLLFLLALLMIFTFTVSADELSTRLVMNNPIKFQSLTIDSDNQFAAHVSTLSFTVPDTVTGLNYVTASTFDTFTCKIIGPVPQYHNDNYEANAYIRFILKVDGVPIEKYREGSHLHFNANNRPIHNDAMDLAGKSIEIDFYVVADNMNSSLFQENSTYKITGLDNLGTIGFGVGGSWSDPLSIIDLSGNTAFPVIPEGEINPEDGSIGTGSFPYGDVEPEPDPPSVSMSLEDKKATLKTTEAVEVGVITFTPADFPSEDAPTITAEIKFTGDFYLKLTANNSVVVVPNVTIDYALYYENSTVVPDTHDTFQYTFNSNTQVSKSITAKVTETNLSSKPAGTYTDTITITMSIVE